MLNHKRIRMATGRALQGGEHETST